MKITSVEVFDIQIPRAHPRRSMWTPVIVQVSTDEDISGVGELALAYGIGNNAGIGMLKDLSQNLLVGSDPLKIEYLWDIMYRRTF